MSRVINADGEILVALAGYSLRTLSGDTALTAADLGGLILVDVPATITLPPIADLPVGVPLTVKNLAPAGGVTVVPDGSETIDGETEITMEFQYSAVTLVSDGTNWWLI